MHPKTFLRGVLLLSAGFSAAHFLTPDVSAAGQDGTWQQDGSRRRYVYEDQTFTVGESVIDDTAYLFAPNGLQQVGWQTVSETRRYYDPSTGDPVSGWFTWRGGDYYIDPESGKQAGIFIVDSTSYLADAYGVLQRNKWCEIEGAWYYGDQDGKAAFGESVIGDVPYLFTENGTLLTGWQAASDGITRRYDIVPDGTPAICTGWLEIDGAKYFADTEKGLLCGIQTIENDTYYFDETGIMQTGFCQVDGRTICLTENGIMQTGWFTSEQQTYYADTDGSILTGLQTIDNERYGFDADGVMLTGWQTVFEQKYYFDEQGKALRGLQQIGDDSYYFDTAGVMQTGSINADGIVCYMDADGRRIDGFHTSDAGRSYTDPLTGQTAVGWVTIGADQYYFDTNGIAAAGIITLDGKNYRFTEEGIYDPVTICLDAGHFAKYNRSPVNPTYYESDFNWKLHLCLKDELEKYNITVITTRPDQEHDLALAARGAASKDCDLFLSLHSNASNNPANDGPLACCTVTGTCDQLGLDLANLIADVMGTKERGSIWKRYSTDHPGEDYYGVLRSATSVKTPAILLEHSYHTNLRSTNWLLNDANIRKLAAAEGKFLAEYFGMYPINSK